MEKITLNVGKKGEVLIKKKIRLKTGIKPGDKLIAEYDQNHIILRKIPSIKELVVSPPLVTVTIKEFLEERREIKREIEEMALGEN